MASGAVGDKQFIRVRIKLNVERFNSTPFPDLDRDRRCPHLRCAFLNPTNPTGETTTFAAMTRKPNHQPDSILNDEVKFHA
jgi:hypothetical protein